MRILLTGGAGFLGWHTRARLRALTDHEVVLVTRANWASLGDLADGADAIVHVAGVNRGAPDAVERGNVDLARDVATAARKAGSIPRLVYADSVQSGNGSLYGTGKARAGDILARAARETGADYVDVRLPNVFGEHGRPHYNSFVATFIDGLVCGEAPAVVDRPIALLHAQQAAQALLDGLTAPAGRLDPPGTATTVAGVLDTLAGMWALYRTGDIPPLRTALEVDLFNTLRAAVFPGHYPLPLTVHADQRGALVETVRAHGGQGQTFVSTTRPGVTRGEHFHLGKVERFVVLGGQARITLRKLFTRQIVSFDVSGDAPAVVDMPTLWAHNIANVGAGDLTTLFWTHTLFDPAAPDTYPEKAGS